MTVTGLFDKEKTINLHENKLRYKVFNQRKNG